MSSLESKQCILGIVRAMLTLEYMGWNLRKAIRQPVHGRPEELACRRSLDAVYALEATVSNVDILSLPSTRFTILLRKATYDELLHHMEEVIRQEVGVRSINEGLANVRVLDGGPRHFDCLLGQEIDRGPVRDIVGPPTLGGYLARMAALRLDGSRSHGHHGAHMRRGRRHVVWMWGEGGSSSTAWRLHHWCLIWMMVWKLVGLVLVRMLTGSAREIPLNSLRL
mmetsp:Transcript_1442/g.2827  ORF Transcript_1442/g.2827 Transcript_1442/m.2827 type:complete len:224 (-) Transcript_1442:172-843(-)